MSDIIDCPPGHLLLVSKDPCAFVAATQEAIDGYLDEFRNTDKKEMERILSMSKRLVAIKNIDPKRWGIAAIVCALAPNVLYGEPILCTDPEDVRKRGTRQGGIVKLG